MQKQGQPSLREIQRREREDLILRAAKDVFLEKGYYETSIDEIATLVGVAKGTIYLHFSSKEELVIAIVKKSMETFLQEIDLVTASEKTARAKLEDLLLSMYTGLFSEEARFFNSLFNNVDLRRMMEEKKHAVRPLIDMLLAKVTVLLEEGKAAGEIDSSLPTSVLASSFFQLLSPRSYESLIIGDALPPEKLAYYLARIYFSGISSPTKAE
jgi:AcrR family transcriptional regulator